MNSLGETLRQARLDQGLDLAEVAVRTRINPKYLEAIESDRRELLPGSFFYRSFVQQYAAALSLDIAPLDAEIDRILRDEKPLPLPGEVDAESAAIRPDRRPVAMWVALLFFIVAGSSAFYAWWHQARNAHVADAPRVEHATVSASTVPAAPANRVQLEISVTEQTWLSLSSDGKQIFSGVLQPSDTKTVEGRESAKLKVGNAAGLEVRLNGKSIGPIGGRGQVRVVTFTRDTFQIVPYSGSSD